MLLCAVAILDRMLWQFWLVPAPDKRFCDTMVGCSAPNCKNSTENGTRLFRFPNDQKRRQRWLLNSRRDKWQPKESSRLCEVHFESNQFEANRQDGRKLLKHNAVPTLFNVPNPPKLLEMKRPLPTRRALLSLKTESVILGEPQKEVPKMVPESTAAVATLQQPQQPNELELLRTETTKLKKELTALKGSYEHLNACLRGFLHHDQLQYLQRFGATSGIPWTENTIIDCLHMENRLGRKGYEFLRTKGYPLPSVRTISRWLKANRESLGFDDVMDDYECVQTKCESAALGGEIDSS